MSTDKLIEIMRDDIKELKSDAKKQATMTNKLYVIIGKLTVKLTFIVSIFSTIGGGMSIILLKYVFKAI